MLKPVEHVARSRLQSELTSMGLESSGSRSELINKLKTAGVYELHANLPPARKACNTHNHSNVVLGNAHTDPSMEHTFLVQNVDTQAPLMLGNFETQKLNLCECVKLAQSNIDATLEGCEGELRRMNGDLYMYRSTNVHPGWYPVQFGSVMIV